MKKLFAFLLLAFLLQSCARVGSPIGGDKDTLAPKFLYSNIDTTRINVPRDIHELRLDFDEYVNLKDASKNLIISPPIKKIKKIIPSSIANKYVLIQWEDTLQANTTYNFNFGNSIVDNNESNPLRYFNFAFSTGNKLDDTYISGEVKDGFSFKKPSSSENKFVVGLYKVSDSINYREKPYYISKVDDDGYYELNYLSHGKYKILAWEDDNGNSMFDSGKEKIAFQKDDVTLDKSISGLNLKLFPSRKAVKNTELKEVPGGILIPFEGHPKEVAIKLGEENPLKDYKVTHRSYSDSVNIWFDAVAENIGQTATANLKFTYDADTIKNRKISVFYKMNTKNKMEIKNPNSNVLVPKSDFSFTSNYWVDKIQPEKWILKEDSTINKEFTAKISESDPYKVLVTSDFTPGKKYQLTVPSKTISSFYDKTKDPVRFDFEIGKIDAYGDLEFTLTNAPTTKYWLQLLNANEDVKYQKYTSGNVVKFDYLEPNEYVVRILVDDNENHNWDGADFINGVEAEGVYVYYSPVIIRPLWNSKESWDLKDTRVLDVKKLQNKPTENKKEDKKDVLLDQNNPNNRFNNNINNGLQNNRNLQFQPMR